MTDGANGRCFCGKLQFELEGQPLWVAHCHCDSCRRNTGSAVATFVGYNKEQLTYTRGKELPLIWTQQVIRPVQSCS